MKKMCVNMLAGREMPRFQSGQFTLSFLKMLTSSSVEIHKWLYVLGYYTHKVCHPSFPLRLAATALLMARVSLSVLAVGVSRKKYSFFPKNKPENNNGCSYRPPTDTE